jgi:lipopolysaccharide transport system ATP-binding protein
MGQIAIRTESLSKRYRIGEREPYKALRDVLSNAALGWIRHIPFVSRHDRKDKPPDQHIWAIKDISLEIQHGEVVGLIGRNGAGKSTLLKVLSRITEPTRGHAQIHGRVGSLLEVGTGFHPEMTGRENIYLNGAILGMRKIEIKRKFDEMVAFAEVERFVDTPVKHYSSGMYLRLAFSVAAHMEPEILLVDEVLAVGDRAFQDKCLRKMGSVANEGRTVLFVSHNTAAITSLCQRGILLTNGMLEMDDKVEKTVAHYNSQVRDYQEPVDGYVSLVHHPGRVKVNLDVARSRLDGLVKFTHCGLFDRDSKSIRFIGSGDEIKIRLGYKMERPLENTRIEFLLIICDNEQKRIFSCSNEVMGQHFQSIPQVGEVECVIPKLPLAQDVYTITLSCRTGANWSDRIYEAVEFEVVGGDFYGTGELPPVQWGNALVENYWSLNSNPG